MHGAGCVPQVFARVRTEGYALCVRSFGRPDSPGTASLQVRLTTASWVVACIQGEDDPTFPQHRRYLLKFVVTAVLVPRGSHSASRFLVAAVQLAYAFFFIADDKWEGFGAFVDNSQITFTKV